MQVSQHVDSTMSSSSSLASVAADEAEMETREVSPAHFLIKIDSFSLLEKHGISKLETSEFESGEFMWRLVIYPNGHGSGKDDDKGYVSVYLAMTETTALPSNWEANVVFSIFLFNHISGNYRYSLGRARRFHALKQEWGFKKFISKKNLIDPSNGYLIGDLCVFGAEVFINENKTITESLSLKSVDKDPYKKEFKISNFSTLKRKWVSEDFKVGGHKWMIKVYPNGKGEETGRSVSIFLHQVVSNNCAISKRVRPCFTIRIKDQSCYLQHHQRTCNDRWFLASTSDNWGWHSFIDLSCLNDPDKDFIVNDCCFIEIELVVQAISS